MTLFLLLFAATATALAMALRAGLRGRRGAHLAWVCGGLAGLAAAIVQAERMGRGFAFEPGVFRIHMILAGGALTAAAVQIALGIRYWRTGAGRCAHRWGAAGFGTMILLAAVTGTAMWRSAQPAGAEGGTSRAEDTNPERSPALDPDPARHGAAAIPAGATGGVEARPAGAQRGEDPLEAIGP